MKKKIISKFLSEVIPVKRFILVTGPRGSGKTVEVKKLASNYKYFDFNNLINLDEELKVLNNHKNNINIIFDEPQKHENFLKILELISENKGKNSRYIFITSEENYELKSFFDSHKKESQIINFLPLTIDEVPRKYKETYSINDYTYYGFMPVAYNKREKRDEYYSQYINEIIENNIAKHETKNTVNKTVALLNYCAENIGKNFGVYDAARLLKVDSRKITYLLNLLVERKLIFILAPFHEDYGRRTVKTFKVFFYDTGMACYLLGVTSPYKIRFSNLLPNLHENFIILELFKAFYNKGFNPNFYYWKEISRTEVTCIVDLNGTIIPISYKNSSEHYNKIINSARVFSEISNIPKSDFIVIYNGDINYKFKKFKIIGFNKIHSVIYCLQ